MKPALDDFELEWPHQFNSFGSERENFERDVYMLILSGLDAGIANLNSEAKKREDELRPHFDNSNEAVQERLADEMSDIWGYLADQERFLRNMGLVALLSRLTHALNKMASDAEIFAPRDKDGYAGGDEFKKLWNEYRTRFGIAFSAKYIQWVDPLRVARNQIVHKGGEANPPKSLADTDPDAGDAGFYDLTFSKKYKRFVEGKGPLAMVRITQQQLEEAVKSSMKIVRYAAEELRAKELDYVKKQRGTVEKGS
jgi:hypothetical protein